MYREVVRTYCPSTSGEKA